MLSLVYVSSATRPFTRQELWDLLAASRAKNESLGITGMLLYKSGNFMQVLEGDEGVVRRLQGSIAADPRHHGMIVLLEEQLATRNFDGWAMGFRDFDSPDAARPAGFSEFMNVEFTDRSFFGNPSNTQKLLKSFKRTAG